MQHPPPSPARKAADEAATVTMLPQSSKWISAILVLYFDLEFGQKIELLHPEGLKFTKDEESNICFLAFPDSHSNTTGDSSFSFRFPRSVGSAATASESVEAVHLNGFVFNRVQRDRAQKRGYLQKSVVVLTERSDVLLWPLFRHMARIIGAEYFRCVPTIGEESVTTEAAAAYLHAVYREAHSWPTPVAGTTHELPLMGNVLRYYVCMNEFLGCGYDAAVSNVFYPVSERQALLSSSGSGLLGSTEQLSPLDELNVYQMLYLLLPHLWTLWELLLVGETILVFAQTPSQSSAVVAALVSLVLPLRYGGEWRPYFTIHDSDFKRFTPTSMNAAGNCIVGVTNPFFLREFRDWPHKLTLAPDSVRIDELFNAETEETVVRRQRSLSADKLVQPTEMLSEGMVDLIRRRVASSLSRPGIHASATNLESGYRCAMRSAAKTVIEELIPLKGTRGHAGEANWRDINGAIARSNNRTIRRHFFERTQQFLIPLESYYASLMPVLSDADVRLKPFDKNELLRRVRATSSKQELDLYRRFLNSRTFDLWLFEKMRRTTEYLKQKG